MKKRKHITLFNDPQIHAIKQIISIGNEEDLNQLWEYIITVNAVTEPESYTYFINLYELSSRFLEQSPEVYFEIVLEQSNEYYYFTVWNKPFIRFARKEWKKRRIDYVYNRKRISTRYSKALLKEKATERISADEQRVSHFLATIDRKVVTSAHPAYDFLEGDDLSELMSLAEDMNEYLYDAQRSGMNPSVFIRIRSYLSMISVILSHYEAIDEMASVMTEFSILLTHHKESFSQLTSSQIALIDGFAHNFHRWLKVLFIEGGANLHFMDRSMRADLEMIRAMVEPMNEDDMSDLDDIFDF